MTHILPGLLHQRRPPRGARQRMVETHAGVPAVAPELLHKRPSTARSLQVQHSAADCIALTGAFLISAFILPLATTNPSLQYVPCSFRHSQWWEDRTLMTYENIDFKGVFWAGWYDIFLQPMIETWGGYNFRSSAQNQQRLVIGPRGHCLTSFPLLFPDDRLADIWCALRMWGENAGSRRRCGIFTDFSFA